MKSGTVALIGRPNAGKSSLVNAILKTRAVIVSPKPQTTRNIIRCIYNDDESQIIFTDTPGLYKITADNDKLGKFFSASVSDFLEDADLICRLVDAGTGKLNNDDAAINEIISQVSTPVILVVTKADKFNPERVMKMYGNNFKFADQIAVSALRNRNIDEFITLVKKYIPDGEMLFDPDILMASTEKFMAAEIIRGEILMSLRDEIPHCTAVEINEYKSPDEYPDRKSLYIRATLIVETEGQKKIIIGSGGNMIKKIGMASRKNIQEATGFKVFLDLWVKVIPDWRRNNNILRRFGYAL